MYQFECFFHDWSLYCNGICDASMMVSMNCFFGFHVQDLLPHSLVLRVTVSNLFYFHTKLCCCEFCKSYQKPRDSKFIKNLRNKNMFRYTSGISQILLKPHLSFPLNQSSSNVVQINDQNVVKAQIQSGQAQLKLTKYTLAQTCATEVAKNSKSSDNGRNPKWAKLQIQSKQAQPKLATNQSQCR